MAGASVFTGRATTDTSRHPLSISAMRAMLARTAIIFAARSEPSAILSILDCVDCRVDINFARCCNRIPLRLQPMSVSELIYDWNTIEPQLQKPGRHIGFDDETLRDGLQSPSVCEPPVEQKTDLLHRRDALRIDPADIDLRGAGGPHAPGVEPMPREIVDRN